MTEKKAIRALEEAYRAVFQHLLIHKRKPTISQERSLQQGMQAIATVRQMNSGVR